MNLWIRQQSSKWLTCKWTSEATAKIHFILDYLALQTNLKVLQTNKKGKKHKDGGRSEEGKQDAEAVRDRRTDQRDWLHPGTLRWVTDWRLDKRLCTKAMATCPSEFKRLWILWFWIIPETHNLKKKKKERKIKKSIFSHWIYLSTALREKAREPKTWLGVLNTQIRKNGAKIKVS